jgi:hypothetical protein
VMDLNLSVHIIVQFVSGVYCLWIIIVLVSLDGIQDDQELMYRDQWLRESFVLYRHNSPTSIGRNRQSAPLCPVHVSFLLFRRSS